MEVSRQKFLFVQNTHLISHRFVLSPILKFDGRVVSLNHPLHIYILYAQLQCSYAILKPTEILDDATRRG